MMRAAVESAQQVAAARGQPRPLILGVTVLTSLDATALGEELQIPVALPEHVVHLARLAQRSGLDGVVASPRETLAVRAACGGDFLIVTPGIRPAWAAPGDQKRVTTPAQALRAGADYLVVGRPIIAHADPVAAAQRVLEEMAEA
jgi:orotidine-5'-phosphate decarboxylase